MEQEEIRYDDIMELGFTEEIQKDKIWEGQYGFPYAIIYKDLTKKIQLDWCQATRKCRLIRINNAREGSIVAKYPVKNLEELKTIVKFFVD